MSGKKQKHLLYQSFLIAINVLSIHINDGCKMDVPLWLSYRVSSQTFSADIRELWRQRGKKMMKGRGGEPEERQKQIYLDFLSS